MLVPVFANDRRHRSTESDPTFVEHAGRSDDPHHTVRQHFRFTSDEEADVHAFLLRSATSKCLGDVAIKRMPTREEPEMKGCTRVDRRQQERGYGRFHPSYLHPFFTRPGNDQ